MQPAYVPRVAFLEESPFNRKSEPQERMAKAIRDASGESGLVVAPCGSGKSAVLIEAALQAGAKVLIFCYEAQGVHQIERDLHDHTELGPSAICKCTGKTKQAPRGHFCFMVTTYGMFAGPTGKRNAESNTVRDMVENTEWDLICCDEAHHMCADTYKPMIQKLKAKRKLGFTATPYRSDCYSNDQDEEEHIEKAFGWFGKVLVRIPWREVDAAGLIAKIGRARVYVDMTPEFRKAYHLSVLSQKQYLAALNPAKLDALVALCAMHKAFNHGGIVFVTHLLVANVVKRCLTRCLGEGWEVLSGGSAHGEEAVHTALENANIVERFNNGELRGLVCTNVAAGAMDIPDCSFAIDLDTDGGRANMAQRMGRVARTPRINPEPGESDESLLARRLEKQKEAWYYDLVTRDTEEENTAARRQEFFASEGYCEEIDVPLDALLARLRGEGVPPAYEELPDQLKLLKEVLQYNSLKTVCAEANAAVAKAKAPHSDAVKRLKKRSNDDKLHPFFKKRAADAYKEATKAQKQVTAQAKEVRRHTIENAPLDKETHEIFRALELPPEVLADAGLMEVAFAPSDDERGAGK